MSPESSSRATSRTAIASIALLLVGCALGIFLGRWLFPPVVIERASSEPVAQPTDLAPALMDLRHLIEALPASLRQPTVASATEASARVPAAGGDAPALDRLTAAVNELSDLLRRDRVGRNGALAASNQALAAFAGQGYPSLGAVQQALVTHRLNDGKNWWFSAANALTREHQFWTRDQLLERYGAPAFVKADGASHEISLDYDGIRSPSGHWTICFVVSEGILGRVELRHDAQ
jgi:hypothetical protein